MADLEELGFIEKPIHPQDVFRQKKGIGTMLTICCHPSN